MNLEQSQRDFIAEIKQKVRQAQYEALQAVNTRLIQLYWEIGKSIAGKQSEGWGQAVVPALSRELQAEFPGVSGFSVTNLWLMAQFYTEYHAVENLQPLVGEISWSKHIHHRKSARGLPPSPARRQGNQRKIKRLSGCFISAASR